MTDRPQWVGELARAIFLAETKSNEVSMEGDYEVLHPKKKDAYELLAIATVQTSKALGRGT